jgi:hypothetical protein
MALLACFAAFNDSRAGAVTPSRQLFELIRWLT